MTDLTAIYYTAHLEHPPTEQAIREKHLESAGDVPIISVSQQPLDFGTNICVGNVGVSDLNAFRQCQLGVQQAKTKYVCPIEADFLYPPAYFQFEPPRDDTLYLMNPIYVLWCQKRHVRRFFKKAVGSEGAAVGSEGAMVVARDYLLKVFDAMLEGCPQWAPDGAHFHHMLHTGRWGKAQIDTPIVTLKTDRNMGRKTPICPQSQTLEIPYWGTVQEMFDRYHITI